MNKPLGDDDLKRFIPGCKVILYKEFANYTDIMELFKDEPYLIFLYETSIRKGHWCCLRVLDNEIYFFDSYGDPIDSQLLYNNKSENIYLGQSKPYLSMLLNKTNVPVWYNDVQYQRDGDKIETCGRHCVFFICSKMDLDKYYTFMKELSKKDKLNYDAIVAKYIK